MSKTERRSQAYHATGVGHYYSDGSRYHWAEKCARRSREKNSPRAVDTVVAWQSEGLDPCPECCPVHDPESGLSILWMLEDDQL